MDNFIILNYNLFIVLSTLLYIAIPNWDKRKEGKALRILFFSFASIPKDKDQFIFVLRVLLSISIHLIDKSLNAFLNC